MTELVALAPPYEAEATRHELAKALDDLEPSEMDRERSLVRLACVRLGAGYPRSILRVLPMVLGDFTYRILREEIDLRPVLPQMVDTLRSNTDPAVLELAHRFLDRNLSPGAVMELLDSLARVAPAAALPVLLTAMSAESASLGAATLGGLDTYREDFENRASPEAMA